MDLERRIDAIWREAAAQSEQRAKLDQKLFLALRTGDQAEVRRLRALIKELEDAQDAFFRSATVDRLSASFCDQRDAQHSRRCVHPRCQPANFRASGCLVRR